MLLDGRLGRVAAQLLDVGDDGECVDIMQLKAPVLAPVEKLFSRVRLIGYLAVQSSAACTSLSQVIFW
jgi:hypothetical protein